MKKLLPLILLIFSINLLQAQGLPTTVRQTIKLDEKAKVRDAGEI